MEIDTSVSGGYLFFNPQKGFATALESIYGVSDEFTITVLYDNDKLLERVLDAIMYLDYEGVVRKINLNEFERPLTKLPEKIKEGITGITHAINIFDAYPEERPFRVKLIEAQTKAKAKVVHCPGLTDYMFRLNGPLDIDYQELVEKAELLINKLNDFEEFEILTGANKEYSLRLNVGDRKWLTDLKVEKGFGNLPAGEVFIAPLEESANGTLYVEHRAGEYELQKPVIIEWKNGEIIDIKSQDKDIERILKEEIEKHEYGSVIGEFAIGINSNADPKAPILESEKSGAHIARGPQEDFGSKYQCNDHQDFLIVNATIYGILHNEKIKIYDKRKVILE